MTDQDPWAPWAACDPSALNAVFEIPAFEAQCRALLDLAPNKISANHLAALPWEEPHTRAEFRKIRERWALERNARRDAEREQNEKPLKDVIAEQRENAVRTGNTKEAIALLDLEQKIANSKSARAEKTEENFANLSDPQVMMLDALCHRLRGEPETELDAELLAWCDKLDVATGHAETPDNG